MKVLFIPGREPSYSRNSIIVKGMRRNNIHVVECSKESKWSIVRYISVLFQFLKKRRQNIDLVIVGFFGQPLVPLIKRLTDKPIILDAFMSGYQTLVFDKKRIRVDSRIAKILWNLDKKSCELADKVLLDTAQHCRYFSKEFNIPLDKFERLWIGADDDVFFPRDKKDSNKFIIEFHGNFVPLQGVHNIIRAAKLLEDDPDIHFIIIGSGQTYSLCRQIAKSLHLKNISFLGRRPNTEIPNYLSSTDVGLGTFANSQKNRMVHTSKTFEVIAMRVPLINACTPASQELFTHMKNVYFCKPSDPASLANAIKELKKNKALRKKIAYGGYKLFKKEATPSILGKRIKEICEDVLRVQEIKNH